MFRGRRLIGLTVLMGGLAGPAAAQVAPEPLGFNRDIRPILSDKCFFCHGPDAKHRKAGLRLDERDSAVGRLKGGERAIVPGRPQDSALMQRVLSDDPDEKMPPPESHKKLTADQIDKFKKWIEQGAPYEAHWAYVPPKRAVPPQVKPVDRVRNGIDRWILARLEREGLAPAPEAGRRELIRRLSFDLTGLPPTPEEVDAFVKDTSANAYEKLVDRLLASPRFGERMAVYWLDLVRYADTVGYHGDQDHNISPYRDWVIRAFNENMPFDQFTREQLAGDLLPDATLWQKVASGYNRLLQTSHEGGVQPKEYLAIYAADRIRNFSNVWMGATVGCAQCHDHKYDPYTAADFYRLSAFFADLDEAQHFKVGTNALPTRRPPELLVLPSELRAPHAKLTAETQAAESVARRHAAEAKQAEGRLKAARRKKDAGLIGRAESAVKQAKAQAEASKSKHEELKKKLAALEAQGRWTMVSVAIEPRTVRVLPRGNWLDDSGPVVQPAAPEFLPPIKRGGRATRLDLAHWLFDDVAGLTARVQVNRLWYLMMGSGLARVLDDFGGQGEPPSHPQLLDALALSFVDSGWDVKATLKEIAMSATYRRSTRASDEARSRDPENRLYSHQSGHRLPAEMIRDNALYVSGLLVEQIGGPSVKPYQPEGYYRHLNFPKRRYRQHDDERQWRRGVYVHWQRQFLHPMLKAFDAPSREECTAQRPRSNTPLAALVLLNDPAFVEASRALAERTLREAGAGTDDRLHSLFRRVLGRVPSAEEASVIRTMVERHRKQYAAAPKEAQALLQVGLRPADEKLDPAETAAWTSAARAMLNLNETLTRN